MLRSVWQKWLKPLSGHTSRRNKSERHVARSAIRSEVELLEGRVVPASVITILPGASGTGTLDAFLLGSNGTITTTDGGAVPGSLSTGALQAVSGVNDISVTALDGITFSNLGGSFTLPTLFGRTASFVALGNAPSSTITFANTTNTLATSGGNLTLTTPNNINSANLNSAGGTIRINGNVVTLNQSVNAGVGALISITATGNITGNGAITATNLALRAATGINLPGLNVSNLDYSNTTSGAVTLVNVGGLTITDVDGIGAAGNTGIGVGATTNLSTIGGPLTFAINTSSTSNFTATAGDTGQPGDDLTVLSGVTLSGGANVTLTAGDNFQLPAGATVSAVGNLNVTAGINADGFGAMSIFGNVIGGGLGSTHNFTAQQDIALGSLISLPLSTIAVSTSQGAIVDVNDGAGPTNNFVATTLNLFAARGIGSSIVPANPIEVTVANLRAENTISGDVLVTNMAGDLNVRGSNGGVGPFAITVQEPGRTLTVNAAGIQTNLSGAPITLIADNIIVSGPVNAGAGILTLQPLTTTRAIELGTLGGGVNLGFTDAELDQLTASVTRIGGPNQIGSIQFTAPITAPLGRNTVLSLQTAGTITQTSGSTIVGPGAGSTLGLALQGAAGVNLPLVGNNADTIAGLVTAPGAGFTYIDTNALTVGLVDGVNGIQTNAATIDVETFSAGSLTVNSLIDSTGGNIILIARGTPQTFTVNPGASVRSGGGSILAQADNMSLLGGVGSINSGIGRTTLRPFNAGVQLTLGGADSAIAPFTLGLTAAELNSVTAGTLQIGDATSGNINVAAAVAPTGIQVLSLQTAGGMTQAAGATLTVPNLAIRAGNAVVMNLANNISTGSLAAQVTTGGQTLTFNDANALTIGTVDGLSGIITSDAAITLSTTTGDLTINNDVNAKIGNITLTATAANAFIRNNANITNLGGRPIVLTADRMALSVGAITASGGGRVTLRSSTAGRLIDLGSNTDVAANTLELSSTELFSITTSGVLQIGDTATTTGIVNITAPISIGANTLAIINSGAINETPGAGTVSVQNLRISSTGPVSMIGTNTVGTIAANLTGAATAFTFTNFGNLQVGNVDTVSGITTVNGTINVGTLDGDMTLNNNIVAGNAAVNLGVGGLDRLLTINPLQVSGNSATLIADRMALGAFPTSINVGTGPTNIVTLDTFTADRPINLGVAGDPAGSLNLTDVELDTITAGILRIGRATSGAITISNPITQANSATTVSLTSAGAITTTATGFVSASTLAVRGAGGVSMTANPNAINTALAGSTAGQPFRFINTADLFVGTVDGAVGITTLGGDVDLQVNAINGTLGVNQPIVSSGGNVTLTANDLDILAAVNASTGVVNLKPNNPARVITVGSNAVGTLNLVDGELDRVTANMLRIGSPSHVGNINIAGVITQTGSGYAALSLVTGTGAIVDTTPLEQTDLLVSDLALSAGAGIGNGNDLNIAVARLAAHNSTSGAIQITSAQTFSVVAAPGIDGVVGVVNQAAANVTLQSNAGIVVDDGAIVQSGNAFAGGTISLIANLNSPIGTANIVLGNSAQILTRGNVVLNADPDGNGIGGTIISGSDVVLSGPGAPANTIALTVATDLALPALSASTSITATSTGGSIRDDGLDTTIVDAPIINLNSQGDVGGPGTLDVNDILSGATASPTANFLAALDIDLAGLVALNITQNIANPGNVQIRGINGLFNTSIVNVAALALSGKQLALIGGDNGLTVNTPLDVPAAGNTDLLLGAVNSVITVAAGSPVTNLGTGPTTVVSAGAGVTLNASVTGGPTSQVTIRASGGSIIDGNGPGVTNVAGGPVNLQADAGGTISADVNTTALTAASTNSPIDIRSEPNVTLPVASVSAGTGSVTLSAPNADIIALTPNDLIPDIIGGTATFNTTGIGTVGTAVAALEIDANILNASTANANLWVTDTSGGVRIGSVNVGTGTATLGVNNGILQSNLLNGVPDVIANTLVLLGTNNASFGLSQAAPLEVAVGTLSANTTGTGTIQVRDVSGGLTADQIQTANGNVFLEATGPGANLTLVNVIVGGNNSAVLSATGSILGTLNGSPDVTATNLFATAGTGIGTAGTPLETAVGTLAANGGSGGITISNRGALAINATGTGVTANGDITITVPETFPSAAGDDIVIPAGAVVGSIGGNVLLQAGDTLTLAQGGSISAAGTIGLAVGFNDDGSGGTLNFLGTALGASVSVEGGAGSDLFVLNPIATVANLAVNGQSGADSFQVTPNPTTSFAITGGPPATIPGDTLSVSLATVTNPQLAASFTPGSGFSGVWTFGSSQPITFNTIESLTPTSNLTVTISDGQTTAVPGSQLVYTITVSNSGPSAANGAVLSFPISSLLLNPTFTSLASGGASGNTPAGSGNLTEVLNLPVGGSVTYTVTGRVDPSAIGSLTNTVTVTAPATSPDLTGNVKTASDTNVLTPQADLQVTSTRVGNPPAPGGKLVYSVTVTNNGPSDARNVQFVNTLPASGAFSSATQNSGPSFALTTPVLGDSGTVVGTIAVLPAGASATFTITMKVFGVVGTPVPNTVTATTTTTDPVPGNNTATTSTSIGNPTTRPRYVVGTGNGGGPEVKVFDAGNGAMLMNFFAYEESFRGGVNVAQGDVNGDGIPDVITGSGVGGGPVVKVFDGDTGALIRSFFAYETTFRGGVNVSTGDINGDGYADIFVGSGNGGGPAVRVFDGKTGALLRSFFAYESNFRGGVIVNSGDVNGDGFADIIAGTGVGGGPVVKIFDGVTGVLLQSYFAYPENLRGGVNVAGGDVNGDGFADVIVGAGVGGSPNIRVFDGLTGAMIQSFFVFDQQIQNGVNVAATDVTLDGRADIIAGTGPGQEPLLSAFDAVDLTTITSFMPFDPLFTGGVFVG